MGVSALARMRPCRCARFLHILGTAVRIMLNFDVWFEMHLRTHCTKVKGGVHLPVRTCVPFSVSLGRLDALQLNLVCG